MIFVGVDPGAKGGYAVIDDAKVVYATSVRAFPWDDDIFMCEMRGIKNLANGVRIVAAVEKVGAMHGQGVTSMFSFGRSAGYIEGVLAALGIPFQLVPPVKWKKEFSLIGKDKRASIECCKRLFPGLDLRRTERCRVDSDGKAEAALIAEYARRHFGEGVVG